MITLLLVSVARRTSARSTKVSCIDNEFNQTMCTAKSTTVITRPLESAPIIDSTYCEYVPTGYYEYPYDCAAYISCSDSRAELKYCAPGKLFNKDLQICDTPEAVNCDPIVSTTPGVSLDDCVGLANGAVLPSLEHCDQFIVCINQQVVIYKCPDHYLFNPNLLICDDPEEVLCYGDHTTAMTTSEAPKVTNEAQNQCLDQDLGTSFPYLDDCQQYILCLGDDQSVTAKCPVNAWFDPKTGNCGRDVSPTACLATESTTTFPSTTLSPDKLCVGQQLGVSYPLVTNCAQYIVCLGNDDSAIANCIFNAWYDPATGDCGQDVSPTACREGPLTTTTTESTTKLATTQSSTTQSATTTTDNPISSEICAGQNQGEYVNYPDNCSKYIVCSEPVPIAFYCTTGYYFSAALQQCVDWGQSDCEKDSTVLPPEATPSPGICMNSKGSTLPYPENCQWYLRCISDNVYMMSICNSGEYYDPSSGECGINVSPDACRQINPSTTPDFGTTITETSTPPTSTPRTSTLATSTPATSTLATTTSPQPEPCEGVEEGKFVPYPNDCTKFIKCISPNPVVYDCAVGQEFSAKLQRCMAPWVANCTFTTTTNVPFITTTTELPVTKTTESNQSPNDFCNGKTDGSLVPYPNNCSKFIVCQDPIAVGYACPDEQEFSPIESRCMDAQLANCNFSSNNLKIHKIVIP